MEWIKDRFLNITIRKKMVWSFFAIALIPFMIFAIVSILVFTNQVKKNISEHTNQMLNQVKTTIDVYINSIEKISNYITNEIEDYAFFNMKSSSDLWESEKTRMSSMLSNIANTHPEVAGILIATENDMYVSTGMTRISRDSFANEAWYKQAVEKPEEIQIISNVTGRNIVTNESYSADNVFSLSKAMIDKSSGEVMGVILMDIKHDIISQSIQSITIGEKGFIFVIDDDQHIVYTPTNAVTYRVNPTWLSLDLGQSSITSKINGETYQIRYEKSDYTGWKIVGVFSLDEIMENVYGMLYILITCLCLTLICIIIISLKISQTITKPIVLLKKAMKKAESGDLTVRFDVYYQDEINELGKSFNHMLERIEQLVHMVYLEQRNKRMAELKVLQEQIKPHFLYNTLDTISWMAREYEADDIVSLVDALTNMFRIGLSHGKDYITVKEEITYVTNYLYIQKIRYRSKLNYEIIEAEELLDYEVPKLILQPLVENAIYHGIKAKRGEGHLRISVKEVEGNCMEFSVEDDGSGMAEEKVKELNILLNEPIRLEVKQSFGLFYIEERLRIKYGKHFHVKVESNKDVGTKVTITIPKFSDIEKEDTV